MASPSSTAPFVSLQFSLVDHSRTQIEEWYEEVIAKARGLCIQWDLTGAITLIASDVVWNAVPGNITNLADVLTRAAAPQYRARPDFDPPVSLDPAATAVELANWKLEMDMYFAYTLAQNRLSLALMASGCGTGKQDSLKSRVYPYPSPLPYPPPDYRLHVQKACFVDCARLEEAQSRAL
jgi:hypothetical protein